MSRNIIFVLMYHHHRLSGIKYDNIGFQVITAVTIERIHNGADKSLAFPTFLFFYLQHNQKIFSWIGLKKLEQRIHKCVELKGEYVE
jgi:hypothetical protein